MYDACNCEKSEDCMCAALSSYVHACAARGIALDGWREAACSELLSSLEGLRIFNSCQALLEFHFKSQTD